LSEQATTSADPRRDLLSRVEEHLGYRFRERGHLDRALTHRSYAYERSGSPPDDYERLEFLGDSLLGFLVSEWLWRDDPEAAEGALTRRKQSVVRMETLTEAARRLGLGEGMLLGRGEESTGGREKASLLADVYEAVLGAIFVDGGIRAARTFVHRSLRGALREIRQSVHVVNDFKTILQEKAQAEKRATPRYRIVSKEGPAHAHDFRVEVVVGSEVLASGNGPSRKQAEQQAARTALERLSAQERGGSAEGSP